MGNNFNKIAIGVVVLFIIGAVVFVFTAPSASDEGTVMGEEIPEQGKEHITQGSTNHPPYNSNPPTSGPHWPTPQTCDIYEDPVADEAAIHSLEHGSIWITYKDQGDSELAEALKAIVEKNSTKVLLSPRSENDSKIALASWARLLTLEEFDEDQITSFIKSNRNNSPEPFASC